MKIKFKAGLYNPTVSMNMFIKYGKFKLDLSIFKNYCYTAYTEVPRMNFYLSSGSENSNNPIYSNGNIEINVCKIEHYKLM